MSLFDDVETLPADPIFKLNAEFKSDSRDSKVNLGVGSYKTAELEPVILGSVKKAEKRLANSQDSKEYLAIDGERRYLEALTELIFGVDHPAVKAGKIYSAQTIGGTSALSIGANFLKQEGIQQLFMSNPTWANHKPLFTRAGFEIEYYPYYSHRKHSLKFEEFKKSLKKMPERALVLLHACCHNPTGMDLSPDQWREVSDIMKEQALIPYFDCAYQGFGDSLDEDAFAIRHFAEEGHEMLLAYSCSKNFGLYNERVGALFVVSKQEENVKKIASQIKRLIRTNYSNPPAHGAKIVRTILEDPILKENWRKELKTMRERIAAMRQNLSSGLSAKCPSKDFSFMKDQKGMFSFLGLERDQVDCLKAENAIFMPGTGRINVAGLSSLNLDYVIDAVVSVSEE